MIEGLENERRERQAEIEVMRENEEKVLKDLEIAYGNIELLRGINADNDRRLHENKQTITVFDARFQ